jgi:hypothetical protein
MPARVGASGVVVAGRENREHRPPVRRPKARPLKCQTLRRLRSPRFKIPKNPTAVRTRRNVPRPTPAQDGIISL